jgi:hypothetical protein
LSVTLRASAYVRRLRTFTAPSLFWSLALACRRRNHHAIYTAISLIAFVRGCQDHNAIRFIIAAN